MYPKLLTILILETPKQEPLNFGIRPMSGFIVYNIWLQALTEATGRFHTSATCFYVRYSLNSLNGVIEGII